MISVERRCDEIDKYGAEIGYCWSGDRCKSLRKIRGSPLGTLIDLERQIVTNGWSGDPSFRAEIGIHGAEMVGAEISMFIALFT